MSRLIMAEAFRLRKRVMFLLVCCAICAFIPMIAAMGFRDADLQTQIGTSGGIAAMFMMIFPLLFASISGSLYDEGKLGFYEIMAGNKPYRIAFSKILTDGVLFLTLTVVASCAYYVFVGFRYGLGGFDHAFVRLLLVILTMARIAFCSVLIALCFRHTGTGMIGCFLRFWIVDNAVFPFFMWFAGSVLEWERLSLHFSYVSIINQLMISVSEPVDSMIVGHILLGFLIEFALWYLLVDLGIRKRKIA
ncbi:MAG: hypothetical protein J6Z33_12285 [Lachnospiraceae bacterium]|nr:hypothetical protein [Lachnospiraceae bacterium]